MGDKQGSSQLVVSHSSTLLDGDLDVKGGLSIKKLLTPMKVMNNPSRWKVADLDYVCQYRYMTDLEWFQMYCKNNIDEADMLTSNVKDYRVYIDIVRAIPRTVIQRCVFSIRAYSETLRQVGGDMAKFDQAVTAKFLLSTKVFRAPDSEKFPITRIMLVSQRPNGTDIKYRNSDGFGCPSMMGLMGSTLN